MSSKRLPKFPSKVSYPHYICRIRRTTSSRIPGYSVGIYINCLLIRRQPDVTMAIILVNSTPRFNAAHDQDGARVILRRRDSVLNLPGKLTGEIVFPETSIASARSTHLLLDS